MGLGEGVLDNDTVGSHLIVSRSLCLRRSVCVRQRLSSRTGFPVQARCTSCLLASLAHASCSPAGFQLWKPTCPGTSQFLTLGDTACSLELWRWGRGGGEYDDVVCILQREEPGADAGQRPATVSASW